MSATFHVEADPARDLVRIKLSGFFSPDDIEGFLEARRAAHASLRCGPNQHLTINDVREMKIQSQEIVAAFRDMLSAPDYRSRRLAFVTGPTLARSQLLRALENRAARCFDDHFSAEAWLFSPDAGEASSPGRAAA
ncbi:hypothetical protein NDN01_20625 [Sphingomonas sp. QA11]|uniref:STAS/SEC14 domain-containing protein n=1 Tax=Sphingomonas sp. QA11 TaxID=2950605 RepID=UPI00234976EB|nr:STAS/SEC14 domain-containing protein [Sphingomonas sp. QA11]WCM26384.1 hypothetical protein NDN01_20625 [Sphingomonas sp. QA11]